MKTSSGSCEQGPAMRIKNSESVSKWEKPRPLSAAALRFVRARLIRHWIYPKCFPNPHLNLCAQCYSARFDSKFGQFKLNFVCLDKGWPTQNMKLTWNERIAASTQVGGSLWCLHHLKVFAGCFFLFSLSGSWVMQLVRAYIVEMVVAVSFQKRTVNKQTSKQTKQNK